MNHQDNFDQLVNEAWQHEFSGWDFGYLAGRMIESPLSCDYRQIVLEKIKTAHSLLDQDTGGGEFLSSNRTTHGDVDGAPIRDFMLDPANRKRFPKHHELCFGRRPAEEFYHLQSDPDQLRNLALESHPELGRHRQRLEAYLKQTADPRIEGRDPWQNYTYYQTSGYGASFNQSLPEERRRQAREAPQHKPE